MTKLRQFSVFCFVLFFLVESALAWETRNIRLSANLDERTPLVGAGPGPSTSFDELLAMSQFHTSILIYDSTRASHEVHFFFFHTSAVGGLYSDWLINTYVDGSEAIGGIPGVPILVATGGLIFDANRRMAPPPIEGGLAVRWSNGAHNTPVHVHLSDFTVYDSPSIFTVNTQDGCITDCPQTGALDFDGDAVDDLVIWRPSSGMWAVRLSSTNYTQYIWKQWGLPGDYPMAGDYTADGKADLVVWRPTFGFWYVCRSDLDYDCWQPAIEQFGLPGDRPMRGDFDGDGVLDFAVWRPTTGVFYYKSSRTREIFAQQWGLPGDIPVGTGVSR